MAFPCIIGQFPYISYESSFIFFPVIGPSNGCVHDLNAHPLADVNAAEGVFKALLLSKIGVSAEREWDQGKTV